MNTKQLKELKATWYNALNPVPMTTTADKKLGRVLWGPGPLPQGAELLGTVGRATGKTGALLRLPDGCFAQGCAGDILLLPRDVKPSKRKTQTAKTKPAQK